MEAKQTSVLVVGATGATGSLLVRELLSRNRHVTAIVRSPDKLDEVVRSDKNLSLVSGSVLDLSDSELEQYVGNCDAVASCLGHTPSLKGMYGKPRLLVTDSVSKLCRAIKSSESGNTRRFVLMNTAGNRNPDNRERISFAQKIVMTLIRILVPPHVDNERAANYLRTDIGHEGGKIEWSVVRPDTLIDAESVSRYDVYPSPTRSAIFDPGKTSRINVSHFMAELMTDDNTWTEWRGKMPVIYNSVASQV